MTWKEVLPSTKVFVKIIVRVFNMKTRNQLFFTSYWYPKERQKELILHNIINLSLINRLVLTALSSTTLYSMVSPYYIITII